MEKLNRSQVLSLPNGLTIIRIIAIPLVLILLSTSGQVYQLIAAFFFLLAAGTDTVDGYLARRRKMVTTLGKFLDPLADKLLVVTALIALIPERDIPAWMVIVIVGREIAVTGLRGIAVSHGIVMSASTPGKYKTFFEMASVALLIIDRSYYSIDCRLWGMIFLWVALVIAVLSGIDYFKKFLKEIVL